jgi:hypothetical protein
MRKALVPIGVGLALLAAAWLVRPERVTAQARVEQFTKNASVDARPREEARPLAAGTVAVRLLLGVGDAASTPWPGRVSVTPGEVLGIDPWRFREGDRVTGIDAWQSRSLPIRRVVPAKKAAPKKAVAVNKRKEEKGGPSNTGAAFTPTGVVARLKAPASAVLTLETDHSRAQIQLADLADGSPRPYLNGRVEARLVPTSAPLVATAEQDDFPSAVSDGKGGAWVALVAHAPRGPDASEALTREPDSFQSFVPSGGGDQIRLVHFDGSTITRSFDVTPPGRDVWRPAVAIAGGNVVVVWSEFIDDNWDLYASSLDPSTGAATPQRLTTDPGSDVGPQLATAPDGTVYVAWQAWRDGQADVLLTTLSDPSRTWDLSADPANDWGPSLAIDPSGMVHVAFDSYRNGNYDIFLRKDATSADGTLVAVADSPRFEARPSLAIDRQGRAWVAYEERSANWGKDFGNIPNDPGDGLYQASDVRVRVVEGAKVLDAGDPVARAPASERGMNAFARLALDATNRPRLLFRHRQEAIWGGNAVMVAGGVWVSHATTLIGDRWSPPQPLARSDNLLDQRPALVSSGDDGAMLVVHASDGRLHREVEHAPDLTRRFYSHSGTPPGVINNDLFVSWIAPVPDGQPAAAPGGPPAPIEAVAVAHPGEAEAVARMRAHRIEAGGKTYQPLRGEFHRHTEISQDGGNDGALEDMWRFALDVARFDWIGNGDHDNGGGKEYTWWLIQKTTDLYHNAPTFNPMFTYERSVNYPGGHRNVMFPTRGVRTLPRLVDENGVRTDVKGRDEDAAMLYRYLNELGGICAAHTSGTGMGTDWRQNDPKAEPFVEIYQGIRDSYEHFGAPRVARGPAEAIGGWRPLGMVWNALAMQYKIGFQSSSDHVSTHISYAIALAEAPTREAIFEAFQKRHCYAATDNILLDVRSGDHIMGDEFTQEGPVSLKVHVRGTGPIARVDLIKDFRYVYSTEPNADTVDFTWTDEKPGELPTSWYYVRALQADGEIAWGSPIWVNRPPGAGGGVRR